MILNNQQKDEVQSRVIRRHSAARQIRSLENRVWGFSGIFASITLLAGFLGWRLLLWGSVMGFLLSAAGFKLLVLTVEGLSQRSRKGFAGIFFLSTFKFAVLVLVLWCCKQIGVSLVHMLCGLFLGQMAIFAAVVTTDEKIPSAEVLTHAST